MATIALLLALRPLHAQPNAPYRILFSSDRDTDDNWQLYSMLPDGGSILRVAQSEASDYGLWESPTGNVAVFTRRSASGASEVHLHDEAAAETTVLGGGANPVWSPDGSLIAFTSLDEGNTEVYTMLPNGFDRRPLTDSPGRDFAPSWAPDGSRFAFKSDRDDGIGLYIANVDRTGLRRLATTDATAYPPLWAPDGSKILFTTRTSGLSQIGVVDVETEVTRRLSDETTSDMMPVWTPDGSAIVFVSITNHQPDIYRMQADGTNRTRLTNSPAWDWYPTVVLEQ